jgi:tRNA (cytidine/uridine-2'-O-)-methyltransferase
LIRLILYQPDIPQNTGAILRLGACFDVPIEIIEPCGFVWDDKRLKRAGMDYTSGVKLTRHPSWEAFVNASQSESGRIILFTTKAKQSYTSFQFQPGDLLFFGRESAGVPDNVHNWVDDRVRIPLAKGNRSLNLAQAAAIGCTEALRQTGSLPPI